MKPADPVQTSLRGNPAFDRNESDLLVVSGGRLTVDMGYSRSPYPSYRLWMEGMRPDFVGVEVEIDLIGLRLFARGQPVRDPKSGKKGWINRSNRSWRCSTCGVTLVAGKLKGWIGTIPEYGLCLAHCEPIDSIRTYVARSFGLKWGASVNPQESGLSEGLTGEVQTPGENYHASDPVWPGVTP